MSALCPSSSPILARQCHELPEQRRQRRQDSLTFLRRVRISLESLRHLLDYHKSLYYGSTHIDPALYIFRSEAQEKLLCIYGAVTELCEPWELLLNTFCKREVQDAPIVSAEIWTDIVEGQASDTGELQNDLIETLRILFE
jgi:hypothetical protein